MIIQSCTMATEEVNKKTTKPPMSDARREALFANLEKARQKRKEQAELTKKTKDAEKAVLKQRQEVRLMELEKEKTALDEKKKNSKFTRVRDGNRPVVFGVDQRSSSSDSSSDSSDDTSDDDAPSPPPPPPPPPSPPRSRHTKERPKEKKIVKKNKRSSSSSDYVVDDARERLAERIRNQAAHAAFSSLFPTWQIVDQ